MMARPMIAVTALVPALLLAGLPLAAQQTASAQQSASAQQAAPAIPQPAWVAAPVTPVDAGFRLLYQLKFQEARAQFTIWEKQHPDDPVGFSAEGASYLFEEFNNQGVLTSEFFLDDKRLLGGIPGQPNKQLGDAFHAVVDRAQKVGQARLDRDSRDAAGLLAMTMTNGMLADYASLIEKRQLATLHLLGISEGFATRLLAVDPGEGDAYVALGVSNYILACLPAYKRFFLRMGGVHGDKSVGIRQLEQAVASGHYLQPYAELLVALTSLREKHAQRAQSLLAHLAAEFPENPLFARELAKLGALKGPK
ncbi:MAG TPA: hypothetical protein VJW51_09760 [Candidatus Acidoferrales bacterium]|nr:hypothetical protein [Candidatus Acidoferrales bacterium]